MDAENFVTKCHAKSLTSAAFTADGTMGQFRTGSCESFSEPQCKDWISKIQVLHLRIDKVTLYQCIAEP